MKNNEYAATPDWFKDVQQPSQTTQVQSNYYISGATISSGGFQSINLYNKFITTQYTLTIDDLVILDNAIIAASSKAEDTEEKDTTEEPTEEPDKLGNIVADKDWRLSYSIRVIGNTTMSANLKANTKEYGIVFYDRKNTPISGYIPKADELVEIPVPEEAFYFRCCCYVEPSTETKADEYVFSITYTSTSTYTEEELNTAYSGIFDDFTIVNQNINEGLVTDNLSNASLNLIFQQPLQYTVDNSNNIKIELNNEILKDTLLSQDYVTTIADNPQDILSQKDFKQGVKINGIELVEKNGFLLIKGNLATTGGITAYVEDPDDPGGSGGLGGGGSIGGLEIIGEGNALVNAYLNDDKSIINFEKKWLLDAESDQNVTGIKNFVNGFKLADQLIKIVDGILYLDCSIAVTGGITAYAQGSQESPNIWEGAPFDGITIHYNKETNLIEVIGGTGGDIDESKLWELLGASTDNQINKSHLTTALSGYATESWVKSQGYLTDISAETILSKLLTVDGSNSGLDADKLDGYHANELLTSITSSRATNLAITVGGHTESISVMHVDYAWQLENARTLWGQSFNGTTDVSGSMTNVGNITPTSNNAYDIGSTSLKFRNGYFQGLLNVTGKVTSANVFENTNNSSRSVLTKSRYDFTHNDIISWAWEGGYGDCIFVNVPGTNADKVYLRLASDRGLYIYGDLIVKGNILSEGGVTAYSDGSSSGGSSGGDFTELASTSSTNLAITIGGTRKTITQLYSKYADQLRTPRTIWGKSFDGTGSISGVLNSVSGINFSGNGYFNIDEYGNFGATLNSDSSYWCVKKYDGTPALAITSANGRIGIGTSSPSYLLHVKGTPRFEASSIVINNGCFITNDPSDKDSTYSIPWYCLGLWQSASTSWNILPIISGYYGVRIRTSGGTSSFQTNGNLVIPGTVSSSSDIRLKTNIEPLSNRGYITPITYLKNGIKQIGFSAQDVQKLYPELVEVDDTPEHYLTMNYSQYVAVLQAQIIELNERIKKLEQLNS